MNALRLPVKGERMRLACFSAFAWQNRRLFPPLHRRQAVLPFPLCIASPL